jgi:hypothetical protein
MKRVNATFRSGRDLVRELGIQLVCLAFALQALAFLVHIGALSRLSPAAERYVAAFCAATPGEGREAPATMAGLVACPVCQVVAASAALPEPVVIPVPTVWWSVAFAVALVTAPVRTDLPVRYARGPPPAR